MAKKSRSTSNRTAKQQRQAKALAQRRADLMVVGMAEAMRLDAFPVLHDGEVKILTAERIRACFEAELRSDGEAPLEGEGEFRAMLSDDVRTGSLRLRRDGYWESDVNYFEDAPTL
ncbi:hypothetical protein [Streptomyces brasiliensis]|uniref:Uncharacterized protein n=1 Tax=Streptomyces brasiliensis TaxID=1954 RepID=A0A917UKV0_9ACTN|nr:hypothetical protein [Streptomyces brasiliensis]GGJ63905.1 hypothetical protein GCM10010121_088200 [Streptomyces brasiliensis]